MSSSYRPQSPDRSAYAPHLAQVNTYRPQSPDLSGLGSPKIQGGYNPQQRTFSGPGYGNNGYAPTTFQPTSVPTSQPVYDQQYQHYDMPPRRRVKPEDEDEYMPDASARPLRSHQQLAPQHAMTSNGLNMGYNQHQSAQMKSEPVDPTHGVVLKTSFPVARIKRIMQADEDIGKVAQVTPHVVSRALELFMIKLITASAEQARGPAAANGAAKSSKRVLVQHMKKAIQADETFDFLAEIIGKVPDAPAAKAKKEAGSDSDEVKPKKKGRKRKDSADDF